MPDYFLFGGRLQSDLAFPELSGFPTDMSPEREWRFEIRGGGAPRVATSPLGARELAEGWWLRCARTEAGYRLTFDREVFDLLEGGREIHWYPCEGESRIESELGIRPESVARMFVLGPLMALSLEADGFICLHGSAVSTSTGAVGFIAPKYSGKSTLALLMTSMGARLITDDLIAIGAPGGVPMVLPGVHSVRLREDAFERHGATLQAVVEEGSRPRLGDLPVDSLEWKATPLAALYLLTPDLEPDDPSAAERVRSSGSEAVVALHRGAKLPEELVGIDHAAGMLRSFAALVEGVPTYRLHLVRNLDRVPEIARRLLDWHGEVGASELHERTGPSLMAIPGER